MVGQYYSRLFLYIAVLNSCIANHLDNLNVDNKKVELCSTANKKPGQCVPVKECEALFNLLKLRPISDANLNFLKKSQCGFSGAEPKVCCAFENEDNPSLPVVPISPTVQTSPGPGNVLPGLDVCGLFVDDQLVYGKGNQLGSFPWLVLLEYQKPEGIGIHCGGVLITSRYVLTAAHCVSTKDIPLNWNLISVRLGEHNRKSDPDCIEATLETVCSTPVISIPVEDKRVHENYDPDDDHNKYSDIALLRLAQPVSLSEFVSPICLPPAHDEGLGMLPFAISGWGSNKQFEGYNIKRDATVSMKSKTDCQSIYPSMTMRDDQLCTGVTSDSNDTCNADSGGVLMSVNPQYSLMGNYFAVGVMSFGPRDCSSKQPTVYTKVRNYIGWMMRNMKP